MWVQEEEKEGEAIVGAPLWRRSIRRSGGRQRDNGLRGGGGGGKQCWGSLVEKE